MSSLLSVEPLVPNAFQLHLHPVVVPCALLTVDGLFWRGVHTMSFLFGRDQSDRELLCPAGSVGAGTAGSAARPLAPHFVVLCLAMGAALNAEGLVAAAAEMGLHPAVVGTVLLAVVGLFNSAILSFNFRLARGQAEGEPRTVLRPIDSASRPQFPHLGVLCFAMGMALLAEPLVEAAADLSVHSGFIACFVLAVTALFNWGILSINLRVARRAIERELKMLPRPAASRSPHVAHLAFLVLAALVSASWFVEPFAAAAEHCLPKAAAVVFVLLFAALFNISVHLFRSFFLPCLPSASAAARQGQGVGAITAGAMGVGISIAVCLIGAGGSTYHVFAPARS